MPRDSASHPWHDLSPGEDAPNVVNAVIEIPIGSKVKYELDKDTGAVGFDLTSTLWFKSLEMYLAVGSTACS